MQGSDSDSQVGTGVLNLFARSLSLTVKTMPFSRIQLEHHDNQERCLLTFGLMASISRQAVTYRWSPRCVTTRTQKYLLRSEQRVRQTRRKPEGRHGINTNSEPHEQALDEGRKLPQIVPLSFACFVQDCSYILTGEAPASWVQSEIGPRNADVCRGQ